jgi:2-methylcitrate dehydratase PrpD
MPNLAKLITERVLSAKEAVQKGNHLCFCASQHLLDTLAALIVGIRVGSYKALMKSIQAEPGSAPIPGTDRKFSPIDAGSIVAYQTNASVYEDGSRYGACHPAAGVFPALWAMGQKATLFELIQAMVGGYEAMVCLASLGNPSFTQRGFHPTGLCAPFGAAAAAGILLKFGKKNMAGALTLSTSGSCGLIHAFQEETTQPLHVSNGVRAGLIAALMANEGFSGDRTVLERGFLPAYLGHAPLNDIKDYHYFGDGWMIENAYLKLYPGCRILGRADWDAFDVKHLENSEVKGLIDKIQVFIDEDINRGARVTLKLKNGEVFTAFQPLPRGEPELPISFDETAEKFRREADGYLGKEDIDTIITKLRGAEGQASEIFGILSKKFHKEEK